MERVARRKYLATCRSWQLADESGIERLPKMLRETIGGLAAFAEGRTIGLLLHGIEL